MIIRRFSNALRQQEWSIVAIEFVLIIAGVLIALQVDNWNEMRRDREGTLQSLDRLGDEARVNIEVADAQLALIAEFSGLWDEADTILENCDDSDEAALTVANAVFSLGADFSPSFFDDRLRELMRQDEYLDLLAPSFRSELYRYQSGLVAGATQMAVNFELLWDEHVLKHLLIDANLTADNDESPVRLAQAMETVCRDASFRRRFFLTRAFVNGLEDHSSDIRRHALAFIEALDAETDRLR